MYFRSAFKSRDLGLGTICDVICVFGFSIRSLGNSNCKAFENNVSSKTCQGVPRIDMLRTFKDDLGAFENKVQDMEYTNDVALAAGKNTQNV